MAAVDGDSLGRGVVDDLGHLGGDGVAEVGPTRKETPSMLYETDAGDLIDFAKRDGDSLMASVRLEDFSGLRHFLFKANTYNLWFNFARKNSYKENQTPWEIIHNKNPTISKDLAVFPVVLLDRYLPRRAASGGYHVVPHPFYAAYH